MQTDKQKADQTLQVIVGGAIVLFGLLLLADLFVRFLDIELLLQWWPVALVLVGLLLASTDRTRITLGTALALAGTIVLLARLELLTDGVRQVIEIIVLLLIGLAVITPRLLRKK